MVTILFSSGVDKELDFVLSKTEQVCLESGENDKTEVDLLDRKIRWPERGLTWEGDERHRKLVTDFFGMYDNSKKLTKMNITMIT